MYDYVLKVRTLAWVRLKNSSALQKPIRSGSWLAGANDIAAQYAAIHCPL